MLDLLGVLIVFGLVLAFVVANHWSEWSDECDGDARRESERKRNNN